MTGLKSDIIGRTVLEVLPGTEPYWIEIFGNVAMTGVPSLYENFSRELGRWYQVWAFSPKIGQFAVIVNEITERKNIEEELRLYSLVLRNSSEGMMVTEIAPGIDLEKQVLSQMDFKPIISPKLQPMDLRIFQEGLMGLARSAS